MSRTNHSFNRPDTCDSLYLDTPIVPYHPIGVTSPVDGELGSRVIPPVEAIAPAVGQSETRDIQFVGVDGRIIDIELTITNITGNNHRIDFFAGGGVGNFGNGRFRLEWNSKTLDKEGNPIPFSLAVRVASLQGGGEQWHAFGTNTAPDLTPVDDFIQFNNTVATYPATGVFTTGGGDQRPRTVGYSNKTQVIAEWNGATNVGSSYVAWLYEGADLPQVPVCDLIECLNEKIDNQEETFFIERRCYVDPVFETNFLPVTEWTTTDPIASDADEIFLGVGNATSVGVESIEQTFSTVDGEEYYVVAMATIGVGATATMLVEITDTVTNDIIFSEETEHSAFMDVVEAFTGNGNDYILRISNRNTGFIRVNEGRIFTGEEQEVNVYDIDGTEVTRLNEDGVLTDIIIPTEWVEVDCDELTSDQVKGLQLINTDHVCFEEFVAGVLLDDDQDVSIVENRVVGALTPAANVATDVARWTVDDDGSIDTINFLMTQNQTNNAGAVVTFTLTNITTGDVVTAGFNQGLLGVLFGNPPTSVGVNFTSSLNVSEGDVIVLNISQNNANQWSIHSADPLDGDDAEWLVDGITGVPAIGFAGQIAEDRGVLAKQVCASTGKVSYVDTDGNEVNPSILGWTERICNPVVQNTNTPSRICFQTILDGSMLPASGNVAGDDAGATGNDLQFIMYSEEAVQTRFINVHPQQTTNFIVVQYNTVDEEWRTENSSISGADEVFTPVESDIIITQILSAGTTTPFTADGVTFGIPHVANNGGLIIVGNMFNDGGNAGEFQITGGTFGIGIISALLQLDGTYLLEDGSTLTVEQAIIDGWFACEQELPEPVTDTNYANTDLVADADRTHTWDHNLTEIFANGTTSRRNLGTSFSQRTTITERDSGVNIISVDGDVESNVSINPARFQASVVDFNTAGTPETTLQANVNPATGFSARFRFNGDNIGFDANGSTGDAEVYIRDFNVANSGGTDGMVFTLQDPVTGRGRWEEPPAPIAGLTQTREVAHATVDAGQNVNDNALVSVTSQLTEGAWTFGAAGNSYTYTGTPTYVMIHAMYNFTSGVQRAAPVTNIEKLIGGVWVQVATSATGYIRSLNGHNQASNTLAYRDINPGTNPQYRLSSGQEARGGGALVVAGQFDLEAITNI